MNLQIENNGITFNTREAIAIFICSNIALADSIVLTACRLDDNKKHQWFFRYAQIKINGSIKDQNRIKEITKLMKQYRSAIKNLKKWRNEIIAHKSDSQTGRIQFDPMPIINIAVLIGDKLNGSNMSYTVAYGKYEKYNARKILNIEES